MNLIDFKLCQGVKAGIQTRKVYLNLAIISKHVLHSLSDSTFHFHSMVRSLEAFRLLFDSAEWDNKL